MIELIASIVIIGLAMLTIPTLLEINSASFLSVHESKGLYHAMAKMQYVKDKYWDEQCIENVGGEEQQFYRVLHVAGESGTELECNKAERRARSGHYPGELDARYRRICAEPGREATAKASLGLDTGESATTGAGIDDIDDFNSLPETVENRFELRTAVDYYDVNLSKTSAIPTNVSATPTSLKRIEIQFFDQFMQPAGSPKKVAVFYYYAANIGRTKPMIAVRD